MALQIQPPPTTDRDHLLVLWSSLPRLEKLATLSKLDLKKVPANLRQITEQVLMYCASAPEVSEQPPIQTVYKESELQHSYDTFLELCRGKKDSIVYTFQQAKNYDTGIFPWQALGKNHTGYIWAGALAFAAWELPGFLKEDIKDHPERLRRMKKTLSEEVGRQEFELGWAFEKMMGGRV